MVSPKTARTQPSPSSFDNGTVWTYSAPMARAGSELVVRYEVTASRMVWRVVAFRHIRLVENGANFDDSCDVVVRGPSTEEDAIAMAMALVPRAMYRVYMMSMEAEA